MWNNVMFHKPTAYMTNKFHQDGLTH